MSAKSRIVFLIVTLVGLAGVSFFLVHTYKKRHQQDSSIINLPSGPAGIRSVPGAGDPTEQYVQTQNLQNATLARAARKSGGSAVPTITRADFIGNPSEFITGDGSSTNPAGNTTVTSSCAAERIVTYKPNPLNCSVENLTLARRAGVTAEELLCQGCPVSAMEAAGFTAGALRNAGFDPKTIAQAGYSAEQLKAAGIGAAALKKAGFSPAELLQAGFTPAELRKAGYTAAQIAQAGYSSGDLAAAGLLNKEQSGGSSKQCSLANLKQQRAQGVSAETLKKEGCGAAALRAAGFTAAELKNAGFSAADLAAAGYSAADLKKAGFSAAELRAAGFSPSALKAAGFTAAELKKAGFSAGELAAAGYSAADLKKAGFSAKALRDAGFNAAALKKAGYSAAELKKAGYSAGDLLRAGFTPETTENSTVPSATANSLVPGSSTNGMGTSTEASGTAGLPSSSGLNPALMTPEQRLAAMVQQSQRNLSDQQGQEALQQLRGAISLQATRMLTEWGNYQKQSFEVAQQAATAATAQGMTTAVAAGQGVGGATAAGQTTGSEAASPKHIMKAGTVMYAVLDTALNTDELSPILATVVSGPLKESKLIGRLVRMNKRIFVSFSLLNSAHYYKSLPINAVAIDSNTARTALSGQVDNHYMLKYGTIFGASFLAGISDAILQPNQSSCIFGCVTKNDPLDTQQQLAVGLGTAGRAIATDFKDEFSKVPPTIKVRAGTGIGVLIMADLPLPVALLPESSKGDV